MASRSRMRIVVTDKDFSKEALDLLKYHSVFVAPTVDHSPNVIIAGSEYYGSDYLYKHCDNLYGICRTGAGIDNIDIKTAEKIGIRILNTPKITANSVSEFTIGQMIYGLRKLHTNDWFNKVPGKTLTDCQVGIIGFGNIGQAVYHKLNALGVKVKANDVRDLLPNYTKEEIYETCDVITFHIPLRDKYIDNEGLIGNKELEQMKKDVLILNMSRGAIFKENQVAWWLANNPEATLITDVLSDETNPKHNPYISCNNVIITPHIASYTENTKRDMDIAAANNAIYIIADKASS